MNEDEIVETQETTDTPSSDTQKDVSDAKPEESVKADDPPPETEPVEPETDKTVTEPKSKKSSKSQKKIAELSYQNREQGRRLDRALDIIEKLNQSPESKAPQMEDFETIDGYLDARDTYKTDKKPAETDSGYTKHVEDAASELFEFGSDRHEDFQEVVLSHENITTVMRDAIFEMDDMDTQADVAYFLGKNKKEAGRISRFSPLRQVIEIGKLEAKITSPSTSKKRPSAAPKPVTPVGGGNTNTDSHLPSDDMATFIRKRNKELGRG